MRADIGQIFGFLVFVLWIVFSVLEQKRKKRLKEMRERAAREKIRTQEKAAQESLQSSSTELERAEREVREAPPVSPAPSRGPDLEVRIEDLFKVLRPEPDEDAITQEEFERLEAQLQREQNENQKLKLQLAKVKLQLNRSGGEIATSFDKAHEAAQTLDASALTSDLLSDLPQAIVQAEILNRPLSMRR